MEKATFAAGCFWGVEEKFKSLTGVKATAVGYMGGAAKDPTYEQVCTGETGHAEVVQLEFDKKIVSFDELLEVFWNLHDPTTLNKQGVDIGTQYRSAIFFHSEDQKRMSEVSREAYQKKMSEPIVTEISMATVFYRAEEYHQCYLEKNGLGACQINTN